MSFERITNITLFMLMGMQVNLSMMSDPSVGVAAVTLILAAIIGKAAAGWSAGSRYNRMIIALGMIPRGEEALLFASTGTSFGVLSSGIFSAVVLMVIVTALLAPLGLKEAIVRGRKS